MQNTKAQAHPRSQPGHPDAFCGHESGKLAGVRLPPPGDSNLNNGIYPNDRLPFSDQTNIYRTPQSLPRPQSYGASAAAAAAAAATTTASIRSTSQSGSVKSIGPIHSPKIYTQLQSKTTAASEALLATPTRSESRAAAREGALKGMCNTHTQDKAAESKNEIDYIGSPHWSPTKRHQQTQHVAAVAPHLTLGSSSAANDHELPVISDDGRKPAFSYAALIGMAILRSPERRLTLAQIYSWISSTFSYYMHTDTGWHNSIRHNLSLNKAFVKQVRPKEDPGKGNYWTVQEGSEAQFLAPKSGKPAGTSGLPSLNSSLMPVRSLQLSDNIAAKRSTANVDEPRYKRHASLASLKSDTSMDCSTSPDNTEESPYQQPSPDVSSLSPDPDSSTLVAPAIRPETFSNSPPGRPSVSLSLYDDSRKPNIFETAPAWGPALTISLDTPTALPSRPSSEPTPSAIDCAEGRPPVFEEASTGSPGLSLQKHRAAVQQLTTPELQSFGVTSPFSTKDLYTPKAAFAGPSTSASNSHCNTIRTNNGLRSEFRDTGSDDIFGVANGSPDRRTSAPARLLYGETDLDGPMKILTPIRRPFDLPIPDQTHAFSPFRLGRAGTRGNYGSPSR